MVWKEQENVLPVNKKERMGEEINKKACEYRLSLIRMNKIKKILQQQKKRKEERKEFGRAVIGNIGYVFGIPDERIRKNDPYFRAAEEEHEKEMEDFLKKARDSGC